MSLSADQAMRQSSASLRREREIRLAAVYCGLPESARGVAAWPWRRLPASCAAGFFFAAGFFGGSVSSTTIFFGGAAGIAACAVFKSARSRTISASFDDDRFSIRSANCFRVPSNALRSFDSDCKSSFDPNAPALRPRCPARHTAHPDCDRA